MRIRRLLGTLMACIILSCSTAVWVAAAGDDTITPAASNSVNQRIPAGTIVVVREKISLDTGETVTFECDYLPKIASVDFGVIDGNNRFYKVTCTTGSINRSIEITQRGQYSLAIRNNASYEITVVGEIHY